MFIHSHILSKTIVTRIQTEIGEVYTRFQIKTTHKLNHTLKGRHILIRQILGSTFPSPPPPPPPPIQGVIFVKARQSVNAVGWGKEATSCLI